MTEPNPKTPNVRGRGSSLRPANRFEPAERVPDWGYLDNDPDAVAALSRVKTEYRIDDSRSIISENNSPDIPFRYSVNPYRGCQHGCAYCYARPTHEYLGLDAGLDFESIIFYKPRAAELLRDWLSRPSYKPEPITFSGVTDCYQPVEREKRLTRGCLEVATNFRQPVGVVTKNAAVLRDLDLFAEMANRDQARVFLSITTLDRELARTLEPRTSPPESRLRAIRELTDAGVQTGVMVAPIIPGLNDSEIPAILEAAADAGAIGAGSVLLRLPLAVKPVFRDWLARHRPSEAEKILGRVRKCRDGELYRSDFSQRMTGTGPVAEGIQNTFRVFQRKFKLDRSLEPLSIEGFRIPGRDVQRTLF